MKIDTNRTRSDESRRRYVNKLLLFHNAVTGNFRVCSFDKTIDPPPPVGLGSLSAKVSAKTTNRNSRRDIRAENHVRRNPESAETASYRRRLFAQTNEQFHDRFTRFGFGPSLYSVQL